ncbi:hypothetical protein SLS53_005813 [Cytospora paraplurivora]|uniref:Uncharacterized protein n=1 Tax=Cytospora paraplurivora TaxID=2898453 RepID=A0AAN9YFI8_9PEZI
MCETLTWERSATKASHAATAREDTPSRHNEWQEWLNPPSIPSVGVLPAPFEEAEHIVVDGVVRPLLPLIMPSIPQQRTYWELAIPNQDYWPGANFGTHLLTDTASGSDFPGKGLWAAVAGAGIDPSASPACGPSCTVHTEAFHESLILLQRRNELPAQFIQRWQPGRTDEMLSWLVQQQGTLTSPPSSVPMIDQAHLPIPPTRLNAELLRVSQIAIYTSACFLNDASPNIVDNTTAMTRKGAAINMLKTHLRTTGSTTDEATAGVTQLILNEWHWGDRTELEAHFGGLREMVRSRGGLSNLGLGGLLSKLVIVTDITIALFFEIEPYLQGGPAFEFHEAAAAAAPQLPFRTSLPAPLVSPFVPFDARAGPVAVEPHEAAARILDDMRFLIGLVLALPEDDPSQKDLQKIRTTSRWIHDRISGLPARVPATQRNHASPASSGPRRRSWGQQHSPRDPYSPGTGTGTGSSPRGGGGGNAHPREYSFPGGAEYLSHEAQHPHPALPHPTDPPAAAADHDDDDDENTPDVMYQAVRQSALIYSRAIMLRRPLHDAAVCSEEDLVRLWTTVWRVPLRGWRAVLGVFVWVVLCVAPASRGTPHERFVKSTLEVGLVQVALEESWEVAERGMVGALRLARWLVRGGGERGKEVVVVAAEGSGYSPGGLHTGVPDGVGMMADGKI